MNESILTETKLFAQHKRPASTCISQNILLVYSSFRTFDRPEALNECPPDLVEELIAQFYRPAYACI